MLLMPPCKAKGGRSSLFWKGERILRCFFRHELRNSFSTSPVTLGLSNVMSCVEKKVPWNDPSLSLSRSVDLLLDQGTDGEAAYKLLLQRCKAAKSLSDGRKIHLHLIRHHERFASGTITKPLFDLVLQMYSKCAKFDTVLDLFHRANLESDQLDQLSWSAVIRAYSMHGEGRYAIQLFTQLPMQSILPGKSILATVFSVFAHVKDMSEAKRVHASVVHSGYADNTIVLTSILSMYGKCGNFNASRLTFDVISKRDSASWDAMIGACSLNRDVFFLFLQMQKERIMPTENTLAHLLTACLNASLEDTRLVHSMLMEDKLEVSNGIAASIIGLYSVFGSIEDSQSVFYIMCNKKNVDSWNALFNAYAQHGWSDYALAKFKEMQDQGVKPDELTFVVMLSTCMNHHSLSLGEGIHGRIIAKGFESSVITRVALLEMYGRCGDLDSAIKLFRKFPTLTTEIWTVMMAVYMKFGLMKSVFALFDRMQQEACAPNEATYKRIFHACEGQSDALNTRKVYSLVMFQKNFASDR